MTKAFETGWTVIKEMPSWGHIWAAGRAKEAGDRLPLVRLIQAIDAAGRSETGERKAVDLMLNSGWSVEDTMNRMGKTYTGSHDDVNVEEFHTPFPMNPERSDDEDDDRWRSNIEASEPMALNTGWAVVKSARRCDCSLCGNPLGVYDHLTGNWAHYECVDEHDEDVKTWQGENV